LRSLQRIQPSVLVALEPLRGNTGASLHEVIKALCNLLGRKSSSAKLFSFSPEIFCEGTCRAANGMSQSCFKRDGSRASQRFLLKGFYNCARVNRFFCK